MYIQDVKQRPVWAVVMDRAPKGMIVEVRVLDENMLRTDEGQFVVAHRDLEKGTIVELVED